MCVCVWGGGARRAPAGQAIGGRGVVRCRKESLHEPRQATSQAPALTAPAHPLFIMARLPWRRTPPSLLGSILVGSFGST